MKLSIVNFESQQDCFSSKKLVMTLHTEAQSYKCYGQTSTQPNYFYWNQNSYSNPMNKQVQVSNKIKKVRKMSPSPPPTIHYEQVCLNKTNPATSSNQIVYELSSMTNSLFNVSKRRRKQSLHSHEKVFSVLQQDNSSNCSSSSNNTSHLSNTQSNVSSSPKLKKQIQYKDQQSTKEYTKPMTESYNLSSVRHQLNDTNHVEKHESLSVVMNALPQLPTSMMTQSPMTINSPINFGISSNQTRIVRSSISIRELLN